MTAKQLEQYPYLKAKIKRLRNEIADLRRTNELPTSVIGSRPEPPYDSHEIPIGAEKLTFELACQIQEKKGELECAVGDAKDIESFIASVQDVALNEMLTYRYLYGESCEDTASHFEGKETAKTVSKKIERYLKSCRQCRPCREMVC